MINFIEISEQVLSYLKSLFFKISIEVSFELLDSTVRLLSISVKSTASSPHDFGIRPIVIAQIVTYK